MTIKTIVQKKMKSIPLNVNYRINVRPYSEVFPNVINPNVNPHPEKQFVQISIGSPKKDPTHDNMCSYLDFWYDSEAKRLEDVDLKLKESLRGNGLGGGLVRTMEQVGRQLGCTFVRINVNINPSFLGHMGYQDCGEFWEKSL